MLFQSPYLFIMAPAYFLRLFENWLLFMMLQYFLMRKWSMHININNVLKCIDTHHIDTIVSTEIWSLLVWFWILICTDYLWTLSSTNSSFVSHQQIMFDSTILLFLLLFSLCFYYLIYHVTNFSSFRPKKTDNGSIPVALTETLSRRVVS